MIAATIAVFLALVLIVVSIRSIIRSREDTRYWRERYLDPDQEAWLLEQVKQSAEKRQEQPLCSLLSHTSAKH